jgi:hypothetical protein
MNSDQLEVQKETDLSYAEADDHDLIIKVDYDPSKFYMQTFLLWLSVFN